MTRASDINEPIEDAMGTTSTSRPPSFADRLLRAFASLDEYPERELVLELRRRVEALERLAHPHPNDSAAPTSTARGTSSSVEVSNGGADHDF